MGTYFSEVGGAQFEFGLNRELARLRGKGYKLIARNPKGGVRTKVDQAKATADQFDEYPPSRNWWKGAKGKRKPGSRQDTARLKWMTRRSDERLRRRREKIKTHVFPAKRPIQPPTRKPQRAKVRA
jgi:hypothetical protein